MFSASTGSLLINPDTQTFWHPHTHSQQVELPVSHASSLACFIRDEHGVVQSASQQKEDVEMEAKDEKYPFLHSANSQSFTEPQPLIYQHLKQICTCISILLTYSTSTICKLYSYTQPSPLSLNTNTQTELGRNTFSSLLSSVHPYLTKMLLASTESYKN